MYFQLSEEHLMIQKAARDFANNECWPGVIERDDQMKFPKYQILKLADLGSMGMMVDTKYGGSGVDTVSYVMAIGDISKVDASVSVCMSVKKAWYAGAWKPMALKNKSKILTPGLRETDTNIPVHKKTHWEEWAHQKTAKRPHIKRTNDTWGDN